MKRFALLLIPFLLFGCSSVDEATNADAASGKPTEVQPSKRLALSIKSIKDAGQKIKDPSDGTMHEAAGSWMVVTLEVKNKTTERQSAKQEEVMTLATKLIDQAGKTYDVDESLPGSMPYDFHEKPFAPNETRTFKLSFDMPKLAKPDRIEDIRFGDDFVTLKFPQPAKKGA
jgi:hypothetical protein